MTKRNILSKYEDFKGYKFLVVDDFPEFRTAIRRMVEAFGAEDIDTASNGEAAVTAIAGKKYDAILCDYNIGEGGKDGQQVLEESKYRKILSDSQIFILLTAESTAEMVMGALEYEPDGYLVKPFNKEMVHSRMTKISQRKRELTDIYKSVDSGDFKKALAECEQKITEGSKSALQAMKIKGKLLLETKNYAEAYKLYDSILSEKKLPWALMGYGQILFSEKKYDEALAKFQEILEISDVNVEALDWIAKVHYENKDIFAAQDTLEKAVALSSKAILRQQFLGDVSYETKSFDVAEKAYRNAVRLAKHSCYRRPKDFFHLSEILFEKSKSNKENSIVLKKSSSDAISNLEQMVTLFNNDKVIVFQGNTHLAKMMFNGERADKGKVLVNRCAEQALTGGLQLEKNHAADLYSVLKLYSENEQAAKLKEKFSLT